MCIGGCTAYRWLPGFLFPDVSLAGGAILLLSSLDRLEIFLALVSGAAEESAYCEGQEWNWHTA